MSATQSGGPQIHKHIEQSGFTTPTPQEVATAEKDIIFKRGGVTIAKLSPTVKVKYGDDVKLNEAKALDFISRHTSIPVPKVFAAYTYGPIDRDIDEGDPYETYIFMEHVEGQSLDNVWETFDESAKSSIMSDLGGYLTQLRAIPAPGYIGSLDDGPVVDNILEYSKDKGPFASEKHFNNGLIDAYCAKYKGEVRPYLEGMLDTHKHDIVFTHADFRPANIIVKDGRVTGIIDWELAGWYPEHWEFVKAFYVWRWKNDWGTRLLGIMRPYYCEQNIHGRLAQVLF